MSDGGLELAHRRWLNAAMGDGQILQQGAVVAFDLAVGLWPVSPGRAAPWCRWPNCTASAGA
jgi:hypothetical protein